MGSEPVSPKTVLLRVDLPNGMILILIVTCKKRIGTTELSYMETNYTERG
jgi:hypothetical protein